MTKKACEHFMNDLARLVDRMRDEYDMTYAEVVGCLELMKLAVAEETDELEEA